MAKPEDEDKKYYAIKDGEEENNLGVTTGGSWNTEAQNLTVGSITLTGAEETDTVKCSVSVQVTLSGTMVDSLQSKDAFLTLSGIENLNSVEEIDLKTIVDSDKTATYTGTGKLSLTNDDPKNLTADVWLVNKKETDQSALAGKELKVSLTLQTSECVTEKTAIPGA